VIFKTLSVPNVRISVVERIKTVRPDSRALWGKMTASQMLCHLSDSFGCAFGDIPLALVGSLLHQTVLMSVALWVPVPWPKNYQTRPEMDQLIGGTPPGEFAADRKHLVQRVEKFGRPGFDFTPSLHPIFGKMSPAEWRRWGYLHVDHHLRQFGA